MARGFEDWLKEKQPEIRAELRAKLVALIAAKPEPVQFIIYQYQEYMLDSEPVAQSTPSTQVN